MPWTMTTGLWEAAEAAEGRNENTDTTDSMQINRIDKNE
ncbi:lipase [Bacillus licheniformis WX-02]|nr:lipase [Bacillus licheniformis WX-02]